jgi:hypothetical protein
MNSQSSCGSSDGRISSSASAAAVSEMRGLTQQYTSSWRINAAVPATCSALMFAGSVAALPNSPGSAAHSANCCGPGRRA